MKNYLIVTVAFIAGVLMFNSCGGNEQAKSEKARIEAERAMFVADSIAKEHARIDSLNLLTIERCKPLFIEKNDEFSDYTWVKPKSAPKYRNRNGIYCYFATKNGSASNFRFVFQYYGGDWLFIQNMVFNIDGENIIIIPSNMETDCNLSIWEWCDELVQSGNATYSINEEFISKIANAKSVKVKLNGRKYYDTRTLTSSQIKSIKDTYEYFKALGGKIG